MLRALMICVTVLATSFQQPAFWCPMHPDERASSAIACPICKMTMVRIPPMKVGEYRMDVAPIVAASGRGLRGIRVTLREPDGGAVVPALDTVHDKPLHLFVISRDLEFFRHVHPETYTSGPIEFRIDVPAGEYMVIADFLPTGGTPQLIQRLIVVPGGSASPVGSPRSTPAFGVAGGVRAQIVSSTDLVAGSKSNLRITLTGASDGRPIQDLEAYLGAAAHLIIVNQSLTTAVHGHPQADSGSDAEAHVLSFDVTFPQAERYKAWLQFQRIGTVVTIPLGLTVR